VIIGGAISNIVLFVPGALLAWITDTWDDGQKYTWDKLNEIAHDKRNTTTERLQAL
jgi:hypothetical protein